MHPLSRFFLNRLRRCLLASVGLLLFALGFYMQLSANVGLSPWTALNQGLSMRLPITFGQASITVSVIIIIADLLMKEVGRMTQTCNYFPILLIKEHLFS